MRIAIALVIACAATSVRADPASVALLPLDAEAKLEIYGQPVASEVARAEGGASCPRCNLFQADLDNKVLKGKESIALDIRSAL